MSPSPATRPDSFDTTATTASRKTAEPQPVVSVAGDALARAAETEHATSAWVAVKTYWPAFLWCHLLWGYDSQVGGGTLAIPSFRRDFGRPYGVDDHVLPARWQSAFNSMSSLGGIFGSLTVGWIVGRFGMRGTLALASAISTCAVFIQFFTPPHVNAQLLVGKLLNGVALGMFVTSAAGFCFELSPLALRGITTGSVNLWIVVGQLLSNCVIQATGDRSDAYAYRIPFAVQWVFPLFLVVGLGFAPESPWHLVRRGDDAGARAAITRLGAGHVDADLFVAQIRDTVALEAAYRASASYADCFRGVDARRTLIACMVFVLQQASGVVFVLGFSSYFFQLAGFATAKSFQLGLGVTAIGVVGNLCALFSVNRVGRRALFLCGMLACVLVNLVVGFASLAHSLTARWAQAAFTIIFNFFYQASIGPVGYVIFAEVGAARLRAKTVSIGICVNSLCGMVANIVIPYMVNPDEGDLGGKVGFVFGGAGILGLIWTWSFIPETRHRTVDELDKLFEAKIKARAFRMAVLDHQGAA